MKDRPIILDIVMILLLFGIGIILMIIMIQNERQWSVLQGVRKNQEEVSKQNREFLNIISDLKANRSSGSQVIVKEVIKDSGTISSSDKTGQNKESKQNTVAQVPGLPPGVTLPVVPKFKRGDENADAGDWVYYTIRREPNSMNPLIESDAYLTELFSRANDKLAERMWDDFSIWEPKLARAWTKEMEVEVYCNDAATLKKGIEEKWGKDRLEKLNIKEVAIVGPGHLHLKIDNVNTDYRDLLKKDFGDQIKQQWWFTIDFQGSEFLDGKPINVDSVEKIFQQLVGKDDEVNKVVLPVWKRYDSIVYILAGKKETADRFGKIIEEWQKTKENKCFQPDPNSATGKKEVSIISNMNRETYVGHEKPIFTFYLRKDAKWHDGVPFTGKDIIFSHNTVMIPEINAGRTRQGYKDCKSIELVNGDPHVVRFRWNKPYFASFSWSAGITVLPEHIFKWNKPEEFNTGPQNQKLVGTGAYKLHKWDRQKKEFVFVRYNNYYGRKPHLDRIVYRFVSDPSVIPEVLKNGDIDLGELLPDKMAVLEKDQEFQKKFIINKSTARAYYYVGWNARKPLFKDKKVRQALSMLVDRNRICQKIMRGYGIPQNGPVHPEVPGFWKGVDEKAWRYKPQKAKQQLAEAGWKDTDGDGVLDKDGIPFRFILKIRPNNPMHESIANLIKSSFSQAGIEVIVNNLDWKILLKDLYTRNFEATIMGWQLGIEVDPYQLWHSSQVGGYESNYCNFKNKEADDLIIRIRSELNDQKRFKMLERFQQIIHEEQPYTFLFVPMDLAAYDKRIRNVGFKLIGTDDSRWFVPLAEQKYK